MKRKNKVLDSMPKYDHGLRPYPWTRHTHTSFSPRWKRRVHLVLLVLRRCRVPTDVSDAVLSCLAPKPISLNRYAYLEKQPLPSPMYWPAVDYRNQREAPWQSRVVMDQLAAKKPIEVLGYVKTLIAGHGKAWVLEMMYLQWNIRADTQSELAGRLRRLIDIMLQKKEDEQLYSLNPI